MDLRNTFRQFLARGPTGTTVLHAYRAGVLPVCRFASNPRAEFTEWREFCSFRRECGSLFGSRFDRPADGSALFVDMFGGLVHGAKIVLLLARALQHRGARCYALTTRGAPVNRYYGLIGVRKIYLEDYSHRTDVAPETADGALEDTRTQTDLLRLSFDGVNVGKYACSTLMRRMRVGSLDLQDENVRRRVRDELHRAVGGATAAAQVLQELKPTTLVFLERGYMPWGAFFDLGVRDGLNVIQWCGCHCEDALMLKRYAQTNHDQHPASLSEKTWHTLLRKPWGEPQRNAVHEELRRNYAAGTWFSEVGTQFNTRLADAGELRSQLGLDPATKIAVIFPHLFWDATFFWGQDLFADYREWFVETVKLACANTRVNWLVKIHPANTVKSHRDGHVGEPCESLAIRECIGELPAHVRVLPVNTSISTYSLFNLMDYCVTVRGTIGIEATAFGVRTLTAGTGRYDRHGFTLDADTREEYRANVMALPDIPPMTAREIELAQKFAYGTFLVRPFRLKSLRLGFRQDQRATPVVEYRIHTAEELAQATDVRRFAEWALDSRDEDYTDSPGDQDHRSFPHGSQASALRAES